MPKRPIRTAGDRAALPQRREPYWHPISKGLAVGYRVTKSFEHGTWIGRWRDPATNKHLTGALGQFVDVYSADGRRLEVKAFDEAQKAAITWAADMQAGIVNTRPTVWQACEHYLNTKLAGRPKAKAGAKSVFRYRVENDILARIKLAELRKQHLRDWMQRCVDATLERSGGDASDPEALRRARDTANRDFRSLRAALNLAFSDGMCASAAPWSGGIAFPDTTRSRSNYLTQPQVDAWIEATPEPLAAFLRGLSETAARPGELAILRVQDFDASKGTLTVTTGKRKEGHAKLLRTVPLTTAAAAFIKAQAANRIAAAPLFADANGNAWNSTTWQPCAQFATIAGLPSGTTAYDLRHATISRWLAGGLSIFEAAKLAGTSPAMIEKHYGHLLTGVTRDRLDSAALATLGQ